MEHPSIATLIRSRQRLSELLNDQGNAEDSSGLISTCRSLVGTIDEVLTLLKPCSHDNGSEFARTYECFIANNRDIGLESDLANMFVELEREAVDAIMFLEDADATAVSACAFISQDLSGQHDLLVSQNLEHDKLLCRKDSVDVGIRDNRTKLEYLDKEIAVCKGDLQRLEEEAEHSTERLKQLPCVSGYEVCSESTFGTTSQRISSATRLVSALHASPLKVIDEGSDYIVYEYTLGGRTSVIRVRDSGSGGLSFNLEPANARAHKYLCEHLRGCKSRIQIAAILQEALSLT